VLLTNGSSVKLFGYARTVYCLKHYKWISMYSKTTSLKLFQSYSSRSYSERNVKNRSGGIDQTFITLPLHGRKKCTELKFRELSHGEINWQNKIAHWLCLGTTLPLNTTVCFALGRCSPFTSTNKIVT